MLYEDNLFARLEGAAKTLDRQRVVNTPMQW